MKRMLGLYLPFLSTDRLCRGGRNGGHGGDHVATVAPRGQTLCTVQVNRAAQEAGVRPGQTLADARAVVPQLVIYADDPESDRRQLEVLATWAGRFSPVVHIEDGATLIVDITGCLRLFGDEATILHLAVEGLREQGFSVRGAVADTLGAVWALTHAGGDPAIVIGPGRTAAHLAALPVWSLRVDGRVVETLASIGVETIGSLWHLPRSSVAARFGPAILDRIDQALGECPEVLRLHRPQSAVSSCVDLPAPAVRHDHLCEAVRRGLDDFCGALSQRVAGVRQLFVTLHGPAGGGEEPPAGCNVTVPLQLFEPTRSADYLDRLFRVALERVRLSAPVEAVTVYAGETEPLDGWQEELFPTQRVDVHAVAGLVDRLSSRLGARAVLCPQLLNEHHPERAFRYLPARDLAALRKRRGGPRMECVALAGRRPLRLLSRPVEIAAVSIVPDGPPIGFRFGPTHHAVSDCRGPERIETGWWRGRHIQRDYYRVVTDQGRRCWIFRDRRTGQWFLHGWFD